MHTEELRKKHEDYWGEYSKEKYPDWHGRGVKTYKGDIYEGYFMNGDYCGKGRKIDEDGEVYEGQYKDGNKHGYGVKKDYNGYVYTGGWKDDLENG